MSDPRDYKLELSCAPGLSEESAFRGARPFLSVHFACCSVYQRIYRTGDGSAYRGRCPRCGKAVSFRVGEGGTDCRAFVVY